MLADIDADLAQRVASQRGGPRARAKRLDARDPQALRDAMRGRGIVVNASLPRFNRAIMAAALDEGLHYIDLAMDVSDPFGESDAWRERGLTAILGMGEDPGLSNLLARRAANGMDRVDSIRVRDGDTASSPDFPFVALFSPETFVEETLTSSKIWQDGRYETVPPFGAPETFDFPSPLGGLTVYSVDHEEVDTLPRFIGKGVRYVDFKLALDESTVRTLQRVQDEGLLESGASGGVRLRSSFVASLPRPADLAGRVDGYAALVVEVRGSRDGRAVTHVLSTVLGHREASERYGATGTAYLTGTPAAVAAVLLARQAIRERGILAPECLDPEPFFPLLRERGIEIREEIREGAPEG